MLCDPEQLGVLKITVFCDAASWFKMCRGTRWYPSVSINYCRGEGLRVCWKATLWGRWVLALKWCVSLPISALKKKKTDISQWAIIMEVMMKCKLTVPVNSWGWGSSFQPLIQFVSVRSSLSPVLSDLKPGRMEKISFHTSNVRRV